jgi:hypothetical protein
MHQLAEAAAAAVAAAAAAVAAADAAVAAAGPAEDYFNPGPPPLLDVSQLADPPGVHAGPMQGVMPGLGVSDSLSGSLPDSDGPPGLVELYSSEDGAEEDAAAAAGAGAAAAAAAEEAVAANAAKVQRRARAAQQQCAQQLRAVADAAAGVGVVIKLLPAVAWQRWYHEILE